MATVKSKLKEQIQKEKDLAVESYMKEDTEITRKWVESVQRIEQVCKDRKRY